MMMNNKVIMNNKYITLNQYKINKHIYNKYYKIF